MRVAQIWRFPLKSAQGESVTRSLVAGLGLEWDRQLAVVDIATGRALTARREPRLLLLSATVVGHRVRVDTPAGQPVASDDDLSSWLGRAVRLARIFACQGGKSSLQGHWTLVGPRGPGTEYGAWSRAK